MDWLDMEQAAARFGEAAVKRAIYERNLRVAWELGMLQILTPQEWQRWEAEYGPCTYMRVKEYPFDGRWTIPVEPSQKWILVHISEAPQEVRWQYDYCWPLEWNKYFVRIEKK